MLPVMPSSNRHHLRRATAAAVRQQMPAPIGFDDLANSSSQPRPPRPLTLSDHALVWEVMQAHPALSYERAVEELWLFGGI
jgi:hypothetical protein